MKYTVQRGDTLWLIAKRFGISLNDLIAANPQITNPDRINVGDVINIPSSGPGHDYVVKKGDTMWLIAKKFGITLDDLIAANPQITDPNRINVGDVIHIPETDMDENDADHAGQTDSSNQSNIAGMESTEPMTKITYKEQVKPAQTEKTGHGGSQNQMQHHQHMNDDHDNKHAHSIANTMYYIVKTGDTLYKIAKMFGISLPDLIAANKHIENPDKVYPGNKIKVPVEKEYLEKKYAPATQPQSPQMPETTTAPSGTAPAAKPEAMGTQPKPGGHMPGTTPAKPGMHMPGTTPAQPAGTMPAQHAMPHMMPEMHHCPMMHHCCMQMMHMMHMQMMHMMNPTHMMMPMTESMPEMGQMAGMEQTAHASHQFPCFGMEKQEKDEKSKQKKHDKECKHRD